MSLYSKVLHVKDTGGTVYNIPLYTSSSDSDLNSHPAPIIMDGQTLYAPYCAEDDAFASPLHCKISGTTYRLQKQKLSTGSVNIPSPIASFTLNLGNGTNTIVKVHIGYADFQYKEYWELKNSSNANWWSESGHIDPWSRDFYVKVSPKGIYNLISSFHPPLSKVQSWNDCSIQWSPEIEAYGLANGVSFTDLNPDSKN